MKPIMKLCRTDHQCTTNITERMLFRTRLKKSLKMYPVNGRTVCTTRSSQPVLLRYIQKLLARHFSQTMPRIRIVSKS